MKEKVQSSRHSRRSQTMSMSMITENVSQQSCQTYDLHVSVVCAIQQRSSTQYSHKQPVTPAIAQTLTPTTYGSKSSPKIRLTIFFGGELLFLLEIT